jgi:hypothetical protein
MRGDTSPAERVAPVLSQPRACLLRAARFEDQIHYPLVRRVADLEYGRQPSRLPVRDEVCAVARMLLSVRFPAARSLACVNVSISIFADADSRP